MSDFKANLHQIPFRLGLRPRPHGGSLQHSPDSLAGFKGPTCKRMELKGRGINGGKDKEGRGWEKGRGLFLTGGEGMRKEGREGRGRKKGGKAKGEGERLCSCKNSLNMP